MDTKQKEDILGVFTQAFKDVVMPSLEIMAEKLESLIDRTGKIEERLEKMDRKFDKHQDRMDRQGQDIEKIKSKFSN